MSDPDNHACSVQAVEQGSTSRPVVMSSSSRTYMYWIVAYVPTINAPATDVSTVNEVLEQSNQIMDAL